jgi:hypothetical protein
MRTRITLVERVVMDATGADHREVREIHPTELLEMARQVMREDKKMVPGCFTFDYTKSE